MMNSDGPGWSAERWGSLLVLSWDTRHGAAAPAATATTTTAATAATTTCGYPLITLRSL